MQLIVAFTSGLIVGILGATLVLILGGIALAIAVIDGRL